MRVVIADDSLLIRDGLASLLRDAGVDVVAQTASADDLLLKIASYQPDVAIVDVRMPPTYTDEGIRAAIEIRRRGQATPLLLFSQYIETTRAVELLRGGSSGFGYLLKDRVLDVDDFLEALRRVASGGVAIDPLIVSALVGAETPPGLLGSLSGRELDVLRLMAEDSPIAPSPAGFTSPAGRWRHTSTASSPSCTSCLPPTITAGCRPS